MKRVVIRKYLRCGAGFNFRERAGVNNQLNVEPIKTEWQVERFRASCSNAFIEIAGNHPFLTVMASGDRKNSILKQHLPKTPLRFHTESDSYADGYSEFLYRRPWSSEVEWGEIEISQGVQVPFFLDFYVGLDKRPLPTGFAKDVLLKFYSVDWNTVPLFPSNTRLLPYSYSGI